MTYFVDKKFHTALIANDTDVIKAYLNSFSENNMKYEIVGFEKENSKAIEEIKLNKLIFDSIQTAYVYVSIETMELLLQYAIKTYDGDPQEEVLLANALYAAIYLFPDSDFCNKMIDANLISENELDKMMVVASVSLANHYEDTGVVRLLELSSMHINNYDEREHSYLYDAIKINSVNAVKLLIENGARLDMPVALSGRHKGQLPLEFAVKLGRPEVIKYIKSVIDIRYKEILAIEVATHKAKSKQVKQKNIPKIKGVKR